MPIGSCEYDGDELLAALANSLCPGEVPEGQECKLPLNPGLYGGNGMDLTLPPELPAILNLAAGTYYGKAIVTQGDKAEYACIEVSVEIVLE